ncbi:MAG: hypothetical protein E6J10_11000 [Chloroflexi bacterium]|nr:MAG: hypothetical protein E6J10_11000 [Chloroflexota bacterium]
MITRFIGITLLGILIIGGLLASFYSKAIEQALTLTPGKNTSSRATGIGPKMPTASPTAIVLPATATQTAQMLQATILAQDTFQRADQALWGAASDGQSWEGDANKMIAFSIAGSNHTWGQIANNRGNQGQAEQIYNALLGPASENVNLVVSGSVNLFRLNANFGVVLRWKDVNNWYKALIDGSDLIVLKRLNGVTTQLGALRFTALSGKTYTLHFRAIGATLFASAWQSDQSEPAHWMIVVSDMSLVSGQGGVRVVLENNTVIHVASFLETVANSGI